MFSGPQFLASEIIEKNKVFFKIKIHSKGPIPKQSFRLVAQKKVPISITMFFSSRNYVIKIDLLVGSRTVCRRYSLKLWNELCCSFDGWSAAVSSRTFGHIFLLNDRFKTNSHIYLPHVYLSPVIVKKLLQMFGILVEKKPLLLSFMCTEGESGWNMSKNNLFYKFNSNG